MRAAGTVAALVASALGGAACTAPAPPAGTAEAYRRGLALVEASLLAHGGLQPIVAAGGVTIDLSGTLDLTTRLQGGSDRESDPWPIAQTIVWDSAVRRVAHVIDWHNYAASRQHVRDVHADAGPSLFLDLQNASGGWMAPRLVADQVQRFTRYLPHLLLAEASSPERRRTLAALGRRDHEGAPVDAVAYTTANGDPLVLAFDPESGLLTGASTVLPMPVLGDVPMSWTWSEYRTVSDLVVPGRLISRLDGRVLKDGEIDVRLGADPGAFAAPPDIDVGAPPAEPASPFVPYGQRDPRVETVLPGIHVVRNLRPGFHLMFVEFDDHVVAIDAPTGWYEMEQIPPMNWSAGDTIGALGEKYLRAIRATAPGKPVRSVVLTHHHSDHIGGLRPFLAAGASVIAGAPAARMAERMARATFSLSPDAFSGGGAPPPEVHVVDGRMTLEDDAMAMTLIELPDGNPKADGYLMVHLPRQRLLYTTAFIYPLPEAAFPPRESIDLSVYFVEWLDASGLEVDRVLNVHGTGVVAPWHLDRIREIARTRRGGT